MPSLDTTTLLQIGAVINGGMVLVWCLLARPFRIAPRASRTFAGAHFCALLTGFGESFLRTPLATPSWLHRSLAVISVALLAVGLRRLMRKTRQMGDIALVSSLTVGLTIYIGTVGGNAVLPTALSAIGVSLLSLICCRDVALNATATPSQPWIWALMLPYLGMALISGGRVLSLSGLLELAWFDSSAGLGPNIVWFWIIFSLGVPITLIALVISRLIRRIEQLTLSDTLTGLRNRRAIVETLAQLALQLQRQHNYCALMIDVDHFKRINDTQGHAAGDAALQHVAGLLKRCTRAADVLGRLGGEEFCVLLPRTDVNGACRVAERLRAHVENEPLIWHGLPIAMTISLGVACGIPEDLSGEACLIEADAQMYRAKAQGRNRVCAPLLAPAGELLTKALSTEVRA